MNSMPFVFFVEIFHYSWLNYPPIVIVLTWSLPLCTSVQPIFLKIGWDVIHRGLSLNCGAGIFLDPPGPSSSSPMAVAGE
jgi:hypothetical protein